MQTPYDTRARAVIEELLLEASGHFADHQWGKAAEKAADALGMMRALARGAEVCGATHPTPNGGFLIVYESELAGGKLPPIHEPRDDIAQRLAKHHAIIPVLKAFYDLRGPAGPRLDEDEE